MESTMAFDELLGELQAGREVRGGFYLPDKLLHFKAKFDGHRTITIELDELSLDEPAFELTADGEVSLGDFPPGE